MGPALSARVPGYGCPPLRQGCLPHTQASIPPRERPWGLEKGALLVPPIEAFLFLAAIRV